MEGPRSQEAAPSFSSRRWYFVERKPVSRLRLTAPKHADQMHGVTRRHQPSFFVNRGLAEFNRPDTPVTVPVTVENSSQAPLEGVVRMRVADRW